MTARYCESCAVEVDVAEMHRRFSKRWCVPCQRQKWRAAERATGARKAHKAVYKAVQRSVLPPASALVCVDCELPAAVYDHRDYGMPLQVAPVCLCCNARRGPAVFQREAA